jgi:hypothetical protein
MVQKEAPLNLSAALSATDPRAQTFLQLLSGLCMTGFDLMAKVHLPSGPVNETIMSRFLSSREELEPHGRFAWTPAKVRRAVLIVADMHHSIAEAAMPIGCTPDELEALIREEAGFTDFRLIGDALDLQTCPYLYSFWFS